MNRLSSKRTEIHIFSSFQVLISLHDVVSDLSSPISNKNFTNILPTELWLHVLNLATAFDEDFLVG